MTKRELNQRVDITAGITLQKAAKLQYGEVEVIVSNSGLDRHGESILVDGIDIKQVMRNPVLLWAHDYSDLPIGKIIKLWKSNGNLMARVRFDYDIYDFADTVYKMVLRGTINAVSIGGLVRKWSEDYTVIEQLEMVELSVVPVGAHPDALVTSKSIEIDATTFKSQYEVFVAKALLDKIKAFPQNEVQLQIKALKNLTSALELAYINSVDTDGTKKSNKDLTKRTQLIALRQTAKQCDKTSELIIASINKQINFYTIASEKAEKTKTRRVRIRRRS